MVETVPEQCSSAKFYTGCITKLSILTIQFKLVLDKASYALFGLGIKARTAFSFVWCKVVLVVLSVQV